MTKSVDHHRLLQIARESYKSGDFKGAEERLSKITAANPEWPEPLFWLAMTHRRSRALKAECDCFARLVQLAPARATFHLGYADVLRRSDEGEMARAELIRAIGLDENLFEAHMKLAELDAEAKNFPQAISAFQRALEIDPEHAKALRRLGETLVLSDRVEEARPHLVNAAALDAAHAGVLNDLGVIYGRRGQFEEAEQLYRQCLGYQPDLYKVHHNLSSIVTYDHVDEQVRLMEGQYGNPASTPEQRWYLAFSLAKAYEDMGDYARSWKYLQEGNQLKRASYRYKLEHIRDNYREVVRLQGADFFERRMAWGDSDLNPVFVFGMPRSGTTLTEHILAAHSGVDALGETDYFGQFNIAYMKQYRGIYPQFLEQFEQQAYLNLAQRFRTSVSAKADRGKLITEKTPNNYYYFGLILTVFPRARFVYCLRDAEDTCLSIYRRHFTSTGHPWAYDLTELGQTYRMHLQLVEHWKSLFPDRIFTMHYADLVAQPEQKITELLTFCDLNFESACMEFYRYPRSINTASAQQVRQPINTKGLNSASVFSDHLAPLRTGLADSAVDIY